MCNHLATCRHLRLYDWPQKVNSMSKRRSIRTIETGGLSKLVTKVKPRRDYWGNIYDEDTFDENDPVDRLDVSILQNNCITPIFSISDPRTDKRIDFVGGIRGLAELERRCKNDMRIAFSMFPTSLEDLMAIAIFSVKLQTFTLKTDFYASFLTVQPSFPRVEARPATKDGLIRSMWKMYKISVER